MRYGTQWRPCVKAMIVTVATFEVREQKSKSWSLTRGMETDTPVCNSYAFSCLPYFVPKWNTILPCHPKIFLRCNFRNNIRMFRLWKVQHWKGQIWSWLNVKLWSERRGCCSATDALAVPLVQNHSPQSSFPWEECRCLSLEVFSALSLSGKVGLPAHRSPYYLCLSRYHFHLDPEGTSENSHLFPKGTLDYDTLTKVQADNSTDRYDESDGRRG